MAELTLIKLGGSVLTDKTGRESLRAEVLRRLCAELAPALPPACIVGHGSGSFGHRTAVEHGIVDGVFATSESSAAEATRASALRLHGRVLGAMIQAGVDAVSLPPADWCIWRQGELSADPDPVRSALDQGSVPLVMGDVVPRSQGGARIASTEEVFLVVAEYLSVDRAIWVGDTDGILDSDGATIGELTSRDRFHFENSVGADVTGGMSLRWRAVQRLAGQGVESVLINGLREGQLTAALSGDPVAGTRIPVGT